jgi:hypothetical protein
VDAATLFTIGGGVAAVVGTSLVVGRAIAKPLRRLSRQNDLFREEWWGKEAEPLLNRPRTLSVPERLARIEGELQPNHGSSMRDALDRVERAQADQAHVLAAHITDPAAHPKGRP